MKRKKIFPVVAFALLVFASAASSQQPMERRVPEDLEDRIEVGTVSRKAPSVDFRRVSRQVAPGVFEVEPSSIRGKRFTIPTSDQTLRSICIGKWKNGECKGIYIELGSSKG